MLVGWLAPMPPARTEQSPPSPPPPPPRPASAPPATAPDDNVRRPAPATKVKDDDMSGKFAWTVTIAAILLITYTQCRSKIGREFDLGNSVEYLDPDASGNGSGESVCDLWENRLPRDYEVHLLLADGDLDSNQARRVHVDIPGNNVLLIFGSASPVEWTLSVASGTTIVGAWLPNNVAQEISGVPQGAPVLRYSASMPKACRVPADLSDAQWGGDEVRSIFGRDPSSRTRLFEDWGMVQNP
jgi:hypothetical protein